jgi:hypothetical protein
MCITSKCALSLKSFEKWAVGKDEIKLVGWLADVERAEHFPGWRLDDSVLVADRFQYNSHSDAEKMGLDSDSEMQEFKKLPVRIRYMWRYSSGGLEGLVIATIAKIWGMTLTNLLRNSMSAWDQKPVIGRTDHGPVFGHAALLRRHKKD